MEFKMNANAKNNKDALYNTKAPISSPIGLIYVINSNEINTWLQKEITGISARVELAITECGTVEMYLYIPMDSSALDRTRVRNGYISLTAKAAEIVSPLTSGYSRECEYLAWGGIVSTECRIRLDIFRCLGAMLSANSARYYIRILDTAKKVDGFKLCVAKLKIPSRKDK